MIFNYSETLTDIDSNNKKYHDKFLEIKDWYDNENNKYSLPVAVLNSKLNEIESLISSYFDENQHHEDHFVLPQEDYISHSFNSQTNSFNDLSGNNKQKRKNTLQRQNELIVLQSKMYL